MGLKIGDFSPLAGLVTGEGLMGNLRSLSPAMMAMGIKPKKDEADPAEEAQKKMRGRGMGPGMGRGMGRGMKAPGMKKGGKIKGAGCCKKGVRKCKMY